MLSTHPNWPYELAGHTQAVIAVCPVLVVTLPDGQALQVAKFEAPSVAEYVFTGQSTQVAEVEAPDVVEYFPRAAGDTSGLR